MVVESPLPGGVAAVVRFLLNNVPPSVQAGGVVVAGLTLLIVAWIALTRRRRIGGWLTARSTGAKVALGAVVLILIAGTAATGTATWNYTQHSNDFCTGCHVMNPAFQRFSSEENKHAKLSCHDCHQQPLSASTRQLYLWVAERPERIGKHAKVPDRVCRTCHVTGDTAKWQHIAATAGHRVHLESDSSALDKIQCVTCHGQEVHRFAPPKETCGQSGCHKPAETDIVLGKMATQTMRHCTSCHDFTADVPALATRDSAAGTLVPGKPKCLGCHEMRRVLADFDEGKDPHGGKCGTCHNPHTQKRPSEATSCAAAGCHDTWRNVPFHVGSSHKRGGETCATCHIPHQSRLDASDCEGCHLRVRARGKLAPPVRFDTARAARRSALPRDTSRDESPLREPPLVPAPSEAVQGDDGPPDEEPAPVAADSFPHERHAAKFACLECHETGAGHGKLTFERPRGCFLCHHQSPSPDRCASCHRAEKYGAPKLATVTITVPGHAPRPRSVTFLHAKHTSRSCLDCHTTPVTMAPGATKAQCKDCHTNHHAAGRECSSCHRLADPAVEHRPVDVAHQRCDACHTGTTIAELTPTRSLCATCHVAKAKNHYDERECTTCHFLAPPAVYRQKLVTPAR